ncbi:otoconin-90 [Erythrolamprus reginae]|uniref:otoconin-90 n=1 Tax=Erythrolamprus reginae TaxID=121349 RepID=UPI00396C717A
MAVPSPLASPSTEEKPVALKTRPPSTTRKAPLPALVTLPSRPNNNNSSKVNSKCTQVIKKGNFVTVPPLTVQKLNPCVMELCKFYQRCFCTRDRSYSRDHAMRYCIENYPWFFKNAAFICEKVKRSTYSKRPGRHDLRRSHRLGVNDVIGGGACQPYKKGCADNITFFNGVFENVESVALFFDCLGSHFTWLQSVFTSFPPLLNFVSRMKCVTGVCPRDFEDYGCACRFEMEGFPVDEVDSCCFQHRKCYEEATEEECTWDPTKITMNVSCLTKNISCESEDSCEHLLCNCDKEAIECFLHSPVNSSWNDFDASLCSSLATALTQKGPTVAFDNSELRAESDLACKDFYALSDLARSIICYNVLPVNGYLSFNHDNRQPYNRYKLKVNRPKPDFCDRFSFLQRGDNGQLKQEFPQLGEMLYCLTDRCPEEFELYGCFCGQEGRGHPTDELDRCCFSHQCCLEQVKRLGCQPEKKSRSEVVCFDHTPTCVGWTLCENLLCSCDKAAAECMAVAPFNESWRLPSRQGCQVDKLACRWAGRERPPSIPSGGARTSSEEEESSSEEAVTSVANVVQEAASSVSYMSVQSFLFEAFKE